VVRLIAAIGLALLGGAAAAVGTGLSGGFCFDYWASCEEPEHEVLGTVLVVVGALFALVAPFVVVLVRGRREPDAAA
jgi:hypothetical protein